MRNLRILINDLDANTAVKALRKSLPSVKAELVAVQAAVRQIIDLQQDLVDAIRLELDDTRPSPRTINTDEMVERACKSNMTLARDLDITLRGARSRIAFVADERWVERILNNLVANAIWHSNGKKILIGARRIRGDIAFEVRDNGRGMKPEAVAGIFEPLKAPSLSPIGQSAARSGLGLYNVRPVHRAHGRHRHVRIHATARHAVSHHPARPDYHRCAATAAARHRRGKVSEEQARRHPRRRHQRLAHDRTFVRQLRSRSLRAQRASGLAKWCRRNEANARPRAARLSAEGWRLHDVP